MPNAFAPLEQPEIIPSAAAQKLRSARSSDARARRSARALREALLKLLDAKPFDQISIRDICGIARVHYATYFRHYSSKEALLDDIATQEISDLNSITLKLGGPDNYQAGFEALCRYVDQKRGLWTTLLNGGAGRAMREEWLRQAKQVVAGGQPASAGLPTDLSTICATALITETLSWWLGPSGKDYNVGEAAAILLRLMTRPLIAAT